MLAQDMDSQFVESIVFDKTLYKYEILDIKTSMVKIMKQQVLSLSLSPSFSPLPLPSSLTHGKDYEAAGGLSISHTTLASLPLSYELIFTPFVKIKYATSLNEMVKLFEILAVGGN